MNKRLEYYLPLERMHQEKAFEWFSRCVFCSVQSLSCVRFFAILWTAACQASLSITNSWSPPKPKSIESVRPSNHLILCHPLLLLPSIFPIIRVFSNESALRIRWPNYWSFSFNVSPMNTQDRPPLEWTGWIFLQSKGLSRVFSNTTVQKHQFFSAQPSSQSNSHIHTWLSSMSFIAKYLFLKISDNTEIRSLCLSFEVI